MDRKEMGSGGQDYNNMKKRTWVYVMSPIAYEISCDKCGGSNITWSEFEHKIFCFDCKVDTRGNEGIFGGPIPLEVSKMFGTTFDRFYFKDKIIREMKIVGKKIIYRKKRKL